MESRRNGAGVPAEAGRPSQPPLPSTSTEVINALAHFHRAEMGRMTGWRDRIDRTTNWAITVVAGMLSLSLSTPNERIATRCPRRILPSCRVPRAEGGRLAAL
jgi:uncharacterized membrane protein